MNSLLTLTTDFGTTSPYVAAMQGVILSINPQARLLDLCHEIPPQDVRYAAWFLREALPYFATEALHVVVVDPGVGTERALLYVETAGRKLLVPDNGVWTWLSDQAPQRVIELAERRWWRPTVSHTFHGRDIFGPVAAHLSLGLDPAQLGPLRLTWVQLPWPTPHHVAGMIEGEVLFIDSFGNLLTNLPATVRQPEQTYELHLGNKVITHWVRTYGEAAVGEVVALISSGGWIEIAQVHGHAARQLGTERGAKVVLMPLRSTWEV
jgi:hypothetical protein